MSENLQIFVPEIIGLDFVVRELNDLEPGLVKQLKQELVTEIKPLYQIVKNQVEQSRPFLRGFNHSGRTGDKGATVKVTGRASTGRRGRSTSLVSVRMTSAPAVIADMAGRGSKGRTASGQAMIANLTAKHGKPSRFVYRAVEREIPRVQASIIKIVEKYADMVNRRLTIKTEDS
jgi:septum formation topological specificity factor MinE